MSGKARGFLVVGKKEKKKQYEKEREGDELSQLLSDSVVR